MAEKGIDGSLKLSGSALPVTTWNLDPTIDTVETTPIGSKFKTFEQTTLGATGSLVCGFDSSNAQQKVVLDMLLGTTVKVLLQLYTDTANDKQFYFSAVVTGIGVPNAANDVIFQTFNFTQTGDMYHVPTT